MADLHVLEVDDLDVPGTELDGTELDGTWHIRDMVPHLVRRYSTLLILASVLAVGCSSDKGNPAAQAVCNKLIPIGKRLGKTVDESPKAKRECAAEMDRLVRSSGQSAFDEFVICLDSVENEADLVACHPETRARAPRGSSR